MYAFRKIGLNNKGGDILISRKQCAIHFEVNAVNHKGYIFKC